MNLLIRADAISDVIAVPYKAAIIDANLLEESFYHFMRNPEYRDLFTGEKLVLYGNFDNVPEDL